MKPMAISFDRPMPEGAPGSPAVDLDAGVGLAELMLVSSDCSELRVVVRPLIWAVITALVPEGSLFWRVAIWFWSVPSSVLILSIWACTSAWIWST